MDKHQNRTVFYTPYISQSLKIKTFFVACGVIRGPGFSTFEIFDAAVKRSKKGLLQLELLRALKILYLTYFQKQMWFYLLATIDSLLGKV